MIISIEPSLHTKSENHHDAKRFAGKKWHKSKLNFAVSVRKIFQKQEQERKKYSKIRIF